MASGEGRIWSVDEYESQAIDIEYPRASRTSFEETADFPALVEEGFFSEIPNKIMVFAKHRFPEMPLQEAIKRYSVTEDGQIVYKDDNGKWKKEVGEILAGDYKAGALNLASAIPSYGVQYAAEMAGAAEGARRGAKRGTTLPQKVVYGGIGAVAGAGTAGAAGSTARQLLAQEAFGEISEPFSPEELAEDTAIAVIGELTGQIGTPLLKYIFKKGKSALLGGDVGIDIDALLSIDVSKLQAAAREMGIELDPAELTNLGELIQLRRMLAQHPVTANEIQQAFQIKNPRLAAGLENAVNRIGGNVGSADRMARAGGEAAHQRYVALARERQRIYRGMIEQVYDSPIDRNDIISFVDGMYKKTPYMTDDQAAEVSRVASRFMKTDPETGRKFIIENIGQLDNAIMWLRGEAAVAEREANGWKLGVINDALDAADEILKRNPQMSEAKKFWASSDLSKKVEQMKDVFDIRPYTSTGNEVGDYIVNKILASKGTSVDAIIEARDLFIEAGKQKEWDMLVSSHLFNRLADVPYLKSGGQSYKQLYAALMGRNPNEVRKIRAMLGEQNYEYLKKYADVAGALAKMPDIGSPTWINGLVESDFIRKLIPDGMTREQLISGIAKVMEFWQLPARIGESADQALAEESMRRLGEIWLDPNAMKLLEKELAVINNPALDKSVREKLFGSLVTKIAVREHEQQKQKEQQAFDEMKARASMTATGMMR